MDATPTRWLPRLKSALGPRGGLVLLIAAHFVLTVLQSWPLAEWLRSQDWVASELSHCITAVSEGLLASQVGLIATLVALGGGLWFSRFLRGALLLMWLETARMVGSQILDGGRDRTVFEAFLALDLVLMVFLTMILFAFRFAARKSVTVSDASCLVRPKHQFRTWQLLALTTEIAVQIALIRALVAWNPRGSQEVIANIGQILQPGAVFALLLTAAANSGAVFVVLQFRRWIVILPALAAWPAVLALTAAVAFRIWPQLDPLFSVFGYVPQPILGLETLLGTVAGWAESASILVTIAALRWLGYDFLPLPRRGGRQSSEATSAA